MTFDRPDPSTPRLLLSAREAARALSVCEKTLWSYTRPRGTMPAVKIGARTLYDPRDLAAWIDAQKQEAGEQ